MANNYFTVDLAQDVAWGVVEKTVTENFDTEAGFNASVTLLCNWANRDNVVVDLLGNARKYPRFTDSQARAKSVSIIPFGGFGINDGSLVVPDHAQLTIGYGLFAEESGEEIISESIEPSAEFLTQPYKDFRWGSAGGDELQPEEAPGKLIIGFDYVQTRYNLSALPTTVLQPGMVNNGIATATLLGLIFPIETLLYVNSLPQRTITTAGSAKWTMTSRFSYRQNTWNKFWRAKSQAWEEMYTYPAGVLYKNYPLGDFSTILV
jgi:hypothetical protein